MRTAGTEGFVSALSGPHLEYVTKNEAMRSNNDVCGNNNILSCYYEQHYFIDISAGAGELQ